MGIGIGKGSSEPRVGVEVIMKARQERRKRGEVSGRKGPYMKVGMQ